MMALTRSLSLLRVVQYISTSRGKFISQRCSKSLRRYESLSTTNRDVHANCQNRNLENVSLSEEGRGYIVPAEENNFEIDELEQDKIKVDEKNVSLVIPSNLTDEYFGVPPDNIKLPGPFDKCTENLSHVGPYLEPTATFAKYANLSVTVQELVKLGVNLAKIEKIKGAVAAILSLEFEGQVAPYIKFLHDIGIQPDDMGRFITKNPYIFFQDIRNLELRLKYLEAHGFTKDMILAILQNHPAWISYDLKGIDRRLGFFQKTFKLTGEEVRQLAVRRAKLITSALRPIQENIVLVQDSMGFNQAQAKRLLLNAPELWTKRSQRLLETFEYVHDEMGLTRGQILRAPKILKYAKRRCEERHKFLAELNRAQYDPTKPLYLCPESVIGSSDEEFCRDIAKCSIDLYNKFLKTL